MADKAYVGIDPGLRGAIAYLQGDDLTIWDMPVLEKQVGKRLKKNKKAPKGGKHVQYVPVIKRFLDVVALSNLLEDLYGSFYLEKITPRTENGHMGCFVQGIGIGAIQGVCAAYEIDVVEASPQRWKQSMGLLGKDKNASRHLAMDLFPGYADLFKRVMDDGRAEAALIAAYGRKQEED